MLSSAANLWVGCGLFVPPNLSHLLMLGQMFVFLHRLLQLQLCLHQRRDVLHQSRQLSRPPLHLPKRRWHLSRMRLWLLQVQRCLHP